MSAAASAAASSSQKILHVAGFDSCGFFTRTVSVVRSLSVLFPDSIRVVPHCYPDRAAYREWLIDSPAAFRNSVADPRAADHSTSPFCWFGATANDGDPVAAEVESFLGGHDDTLTWCRNYCNPNATAAAAAIAAAAAAAPKKRTTATAPRVVDMMVPDGHSADHGYEYDLVVIGGGSGGMAAAKEAADAGAKVACADFVKPSWMGTVWGLGGTCVNVGCIPKKLFHAAAQHADAVRDDSAAFGLSFVKKNKNDNDKEDADDADDAMQVDDGGSSELQLQPPATETVWGTLRENIQNYIRSLNFKYRVRLREKNVTYWNKLATFVDPHTVQLKDKKGRVSTVTSSRFLIAVGGRPAPLSCPGGELAISSDDVFSLRKRPGKTLCVGASYISLETAGFLAGLGCDVTVAVRSILLRGFDRECADRIEDYMRDHCSVQFRKRVVPVKLEKIAASGKIRVTFSDETADEYDTVLVAIGRTADTAKLGLENVGVAVNPKNGRIPGKLEQTACPNIYAVGDVLDGTPELTPVAIQAGILLSRRLFGTSAEAMDYDNVCTTVFTPIEYSCVGLSEEQAADRVGGQENLEVYHREFLPLEWSMSMNRNTHAAFCKVICHKESDQVLGIHYVGPNAGEVMGGFGVAMKRGVDYKTLTETVGIHPTCGEEIVTKQVTKRSGEDAAAGGC